MKISWLSLNASWSHSSLALPLLEQCCADSKDWQWSLVESTINEGFEKPIEELLKQTPDVVLATCYLFTIDTVMGIISRLKKLLPDVKIVLGGPEFLGKNLEFLASNPFVDAVVRGEGEAAIKPLLQAIAENDLTPLKNVDGVCFRTDRDSIFDNGQHTQELEMNQIPDPFKSRFFNWSKGFIQLETSRGCQSKCVFCTSSISNGGRMLPVETVKERLETVRQSGVNAVRIVDRTFNYPKERALGLLNLFLKDFQDLHFHLEIYPNLLSDEMLDLIRLAKQGQLHIEIGIQATNPEVLHSIKRSLFNKRAFDVLGQLCKIQSVPIHTDLIVGLPQQTIKDVCEDLKKLADYQPEEIQVEVLKILKGTPLSLELEEWDIQHSELPPYEVLQTNTFSFSEIRQCMRISRLLDHFYNDCELQSIVGKYWGNNANLWEQLEAFFQDKIDVMCPLSLKARYEWLHHFFRENDSAFADDLALEWIRIGHSPLKGFVEAQLWKGEIPGEAKLMELNESELENSNRVKRDAKTYFLSLETKDVWLRLYKKSQKETLILSQWENRFK